MEFLSILKDRILNYLDSYAILRVTCGNTNLVFQKQPFLL